MDFPFTLTRWTSWYKLYSKNSIPTFSWVAVVPHLVSHDIHVIHIPLYIIYWGKVHSRSIPHARTTQKFINVSKLMALYQSRLRSECSTNWNVLRLTLNVGSSPLPALPTETLYVGSPPWLFVRMSIVQSPSIWRLSLITEHFLLPKIIPLVKNPSRSFPINTSISSG